MIEEISCFGADDKNACAPASVAGKVRILTTCCRKWLAANRSAQSSGRACYEAKSRQVVGLPLAVVHFASAWPTRLITFMLRPTGRQASERASESDDDERAGE
jgi:hypothetical protein